MNSARLYLLSALLLPAAVGVQAQVVSSDRLHLAGWRNAGFPGEIPQPSTIVNVKDYGAVGDGTACDSAVSQAISALGGNPGVVFFPAGTYLLLNALTPPGGVVFRGERSSNTLIKFSCDGNCITVAGSLSGDPQAISSGYTLQSTMLTVPTGSVFQAGDFVEIKESNDPTYSWSTWASDAVGQIAAIASVSGNVITLQTPLRLEYKTSLAPNLRKSVPTTRVGFENLKFERLNDASYTTDNKMTILFDRAADCWVRGCEFYNGFGGHVGFYVSTRIDITGNYMHRAFDYGGGGNGYGVRLESKTGEVLVENNLFYYLRHSILFQVGANGNSVAYNYSYGGASGLSDITMHGNFPYANLIEGNICEFIHLDNSHYENGPHNTFLRNMSTKNYFLYSAGLIVGQSGSHRQNFVGNQAGGYSFSATGHVTYANNINGTAYSAGTTNLPDVSYYMGSDITNVATPSFWFITNALPTLGYPHGYSTNKTLPVKYRKDSGLSLTVGPPSLWLQPSNRTVAAGATLALTAGATGTPVAAFAWSRDGQVIPGATNALYEVLAATGGDAGSYQCQISDAYGSATSRVATVVVTGGGGGVVDFVQAGATWRCFNQGTRPATNWYAVGYDDMAWSNGAAPLGYGDPAIVTELGYGGVDTNRWVTTYFRKPFTVSNVVAVTGVLVRLIADDGARCYLNGALVYGTTNLPSVVSNETYALSSCPEPYSWVEFTMNPAGLVSGTNWVAVELHQSGPATSDAYFDLEILPVAYITTNQPGSVVTSAPSTTVVAEAWVAYNDLAWQSGEWTEDITLYTFNATGGPLVNCNSGTQLAARVDISTADPVSIFGIADATPLAGSDADYFFDSEVDLRGYLQGIFTLTLRFSNLNSNVAYACVLFGNRGPVYADRFTDVTISDVMAFENQGSVGSEQRTTTVAGDTTRIVTGSNQIGQVYRFAGIQPGSDGDFVLTVTRALGGNAYVNGFMLAAGNGDLRADANGNGMADYWETQNFGGTNSLQGGAADDYDGDGASNYDEYRAGTDPDNIGSVLILDPDGAVSNGVMTLDWPSVPGRAYSVLTTTNLNLPWTLLQVVTAAPPANSITAPATNPARFIRLRVE